MSKKYNNNNGDTVNGANDSMEDVVEETTDTTVADDYFNPKTEEKVVKDVPKRANSSEIETIKKDIARVQGMMSRSKNEMEKGIMNDFILEKKRELGKLESNVVTGEPRARDIIDATPVADRYHSSIDRVTREENLKSMRSTRRISENKTFMFRL